jgi:SAM-dependent methyltransferase
MSDKEWFSEWFDSPYYHLLYKNRDDKEAELFIDNLIALLHIKQGQKILDLPCGKGRHSVYFNKKGFNVTGLDLSPRNIEYASQFVNNSLHFFVHDMRVPYATAEFDYVVNLFTSFGYFEKEEEDLASMKTLAQALKPGGILTIDFMNTPEVLRDLKGQQLQPRDGIDFCIHRKLENGFVIKDILFEDKGHKYHFEEKVKAMTTANFMTLFDCAGLQLKHLFGNYKLEPYNEQTSDRMIFVLQKN